MTSVGREDEFRNFPFSGRILVYINRYDMLVIYLKRTFSCSSNLLVAQSENHLRFSHLDLLWGGPAQHAHVDAHAHVWDPGVRQHLKLFHVFPISQMLVIELS